MDKPGWPRFLVSMFAFYAAMFAVACAVDWVGATYFVTGSTKWPFYPSLGDTVYIFGIFVFVDVAARILLKKYSYYLTVNLTMIALLIVVLLGIWGLGLARDIENLSEIMAVATAVGAGGLAIFLLPVTLAAALLEAVRRRLTGWQGG